MRILAISGSLRRESHNSALLRAAAWAAPRGVEFVVFHDLREVPPYDQDRDIQPAPTAVQRLRESIASADAVLFSTPEYNSSLPGQLKNALDWASRPYASNVLRELLTVKSDDVQGRSKTYEAIVKGDNIPEPGIPESFNVLVRELQGLGLEVRID